MKLMIHGLTHTLQVISIVNWVETLNNYFAVSAITVWNEKHHNGTGIIINWTQLIIQQILDYLPSQILKLNITLINVCW